MKALRVLVCVKIDVEDVQSEQVIMNGLVGNCLDAFEIRLCAGEIQYVVRDLPVPVEVYRDALQLAVLDRCEIPEYEPPKECD